MSRKMFLSLEPQTGLLSVIIIKLEVFYCSLHVKAGWFCDQCPHTFTREIPSAMLLCCAMFRYLKHCLFPPSALLRGVVEK